MYSQREKGKSSFWAIYEEARFIGGINVCPCLLDVRLLRVPFGPPADKGFGQSYYLKRLEKKI